MFKPVGRLGSNLAVAGACGRHALPKLSNMQACYKLGSTFCLYIRAAKAAVWSGSILTHPPVWHPQGSASTCTLVHAHECACMWAFACFSHACAHIYTWGPALLLKTGNCTCSPAVLPEHSWKLRLLVLASPYFPINRGDGDCAVTSERSAMYAAVQEGGGALTGLSSPVGGGRHGHGHEGGQCQGWWGLPVSSVCRGYLLPTYGDGSV